MLESRFKEYQKFIPFIWASEERQEQGGPWWMFSLGVDKFNERCREIVKASKWKMEDESMSSWCPRKTKLVGLPNISYLIRKPEALGKSLGLLFIFFTFIIVLTEFMLFIPLCFTTIGTELKDIAYCKLGCILALEIQHGKVGMRDQRHVTQLGAAAACTLHLMEEAKEPSIGDSLSGVQGDAWFGSVHAAGALGEAGYKAVLQVKTNSGLYPKVFIMKALKDAPGGVSIVLKAMYHGISLMVSGYHYSTHTTICFVAMNDAGSTRVGSPYEMKYIDDWGNVQCRNVERPDILSEFFKASNMIDKHNLSRQADLALEKHWLTQNPYFRLHATMIGINVVDCYKLAEHHKIINFRMDKEKKMTIVHFAGYLAKQLISNVSSLLSFYSPMPQEL